MVTACSETLNSKPVYVLRDITIHWVLPGTLTSVKKLRSLYITNVPLNSLAALV